MRTCKRSRDQGPQIRNPDTDAARDLSHWRLSDMRLPRTWPVERLPHARKAYNLEISGSQQTIRAKMA